MLSTISTIVLLLTVATAVPRSTLRQFQELSPRQDAAGGLENRYPECYWNQPSESCPGFYPLVGACNGTNVWQAIDDVGFLAHAALRALYSKSPKPASPSEPPKGPISPADHFFYFFENDPVGAVAEFVAKVFKNIVACADRHDCTANLVICDRAAERGLWPDECATPPGRYGYVRDPNQNVAAQNGRGKGNGVVFMCAAGFALPQNPPPCTTAGGADSLGSALLAQLVQVDVITRPDVVFLEKHTGWRNITVLDPKTIGESYQVKQAQGMTLMDLGFGINGGGLRQKGLANAQNYVEFAKWSWDMNYGDAPFLTSPEKCDDHFRHEVERSGAKPITG
ncbi:MAG: hypothetical protein Q9213_000483 [Squamulea squamosa]